MKSYYYNRFLFCRTLITFYFYITLWFAFNPWLDYNSILSPAAAALSIASMNMFNKLFFAGFFCTVMTGCWTVCFGGG